MTVGVVVWVACGCLTLTAPPQPTDRNPSYLRAAELLRPANDGATPRVRFEWEQVAGARRYVLRGRWTDGQSWAVRSAE